MLGWISLDRITSLVQIAFWTTLGIIAVLSYRQASRSVFHPFRTELFKRQMDVAQEVVRFLTPPPPRWNNYLGVTGMSDVIDANLLDALKDESIRRGFVSKGELAGLDLPTFDPDSQPRALWANDGVKRLWPPAVAGLHDIARRASTPPFTRRLGVLHTPLMTNFLDLLAHHLNNPLLHPAWRDALEVFAHELSRATTLVGEQMDVTRAELAQASGTEPMFLAHFFTQNGNACLRRFRAEGLDVEARRMEVIDTIRSSLATDVGWGFEMVRHTVRETDPLIGESYVD